METNFFSFLKFLAAFTTLLLAVGCPSISPDDNPYNFSKEYWGEWLRMDTDEIWYIRNRCRLGSHRSELIR